jgi:peptidoglycan/xylan/chitin deacetylase (PgdA/CDA1 family)
VIEHAHYEVRNYTGKHLLRDRFYACVQQLVAYGTPLSMDQVIRHHETQTPWPSRAFAVTFDEGYETVFSTAAPILRHFQVPATVYVTTSFVDANAMPWIDRIEFCLERVRRGSVELPGADGRFAFSSTSGKRELLTRLRGVVRGDRAVDVEALVQSVAAQCGVSAPVASRDALDLKLSWDQVRALHEDPLFLVGGHSHRHTIWAGLPHDALDREIMLSLDMLRSKAGCTTRHYSYPKESRRAYSAEVIDALRRHGIACCPTAEPGTNALTEGLFHLRRIAVTT